MRKDIKAFLKSALSLKQEDGPCLEWPFARANGYGHFKLNNKYYKAHRFICERIYGPAPKLHMEVAHSCHNRSCCRPTHLRWATHVENMQDQRTSAIDVRYKLTQKEVDQIRASNELQKGLAKKYCVSQRQISRIKLRQDWK